MNSAPTAKIGWRTGQRVLLEMKISERDHEPQLYGETRESVAGQVQERQLKICDLHRNLHTDKSYTSIGSVCQIVILFTVASLR